MSQLSVNHHPIPGISVFDDAVVEQGSLKRARTIPHVPSFHSAVAPTKTEGIFISTHPIDADELRRHAQAREAHEKRMIAALHEKQRIGAIQKQKHEEKQKEKEKEREEKQIRKYQTKADSKFEFSFPPFTPKIIWDVEERFHSTSIQIRTFTLAAFMDRPVDDIYAIMYIVFDAVCKLVHRRAYAIINMESIQVKLIKKKIPRGTVHMYAVGFVVRPHSAAVVGVRAQFIKLCRDVKSRLEPRLDTKAYCETLGNVIAMLSDASITEQYVFDHYFMSAEYKVPSKYVTPGQMLNYLTAILSPPGEVMV